MKEPRFDVIYRGEPEISMDYHFCREWEQDETGEFSGCYGTNPHHGFTFGEAKQQLISYYKQQIEHLEKLTLEGFQGENQSNL